MNAWVGVPMVDDRAYKEAVERRGRLMDELRLVNEFISLYDRLFQGKALGGEGESFPSPPVSERQRRQRNVMPPRQLADLAKQLLVKAGRPMTRSELAEAIEASGVPLAGRDKVKNLGTILWRHEDAFVNIPGRGYWPRDVANPSIGYAP